MNSELRARDWLIQSGFKILFHDVRVCHVQVDLLVRDPEGLLRIVEVKSGSPLAGISHFQYSRLRRVAAFLAQWEPVELWVVYAGDKRFRFLPVDGLTGG